MQISRGAEAEKAKLKLQTVSCLEIGVMMMNVALVLQEKHEILTRLVQSHGEEASYHWRPSVRLFSAGVLVVQGEFE